MNDFYYDLLHIGSPKKTYEQHIACISKVIQKEVEQMNIFSSSQEGLCKVASYNIASSLKEENYFVHLCNIHQIFEESIDHVFVITNFKDENSIVHHFLIDATFSQFLNRKEALYKLQNWPSDVLEKTNIGTMIKRDLLTFYMTEIDDTKLKCYLGSFINETIFENIPFGIENLLFNRKAHKK